MADTEPMDSAGTSVLGRRERKKAATRASISSAALELFLDRGFDAVSIRDIAEQADVAVATIFAHFSGKEALVFDDGAAVERSLIAAVVERPSGTDVLTALEQWFLDGRDAVARPETASDFAAFQRLVRGTPVLAEYWRTMWRRYEAGLATALVSTSHLDARSARLLATLVIEGWLRTVEDDHPEEALTLLFRMLRAGVPDGD
jgi:AcrR family transcriptional regulator